MASGDTGLLTRNPWVPRRALTVAEYHRMGEAGILQVEATALEIELLPGTTIPVAAMLG